MSGGKPDFAAEAVALAEAGFRVFPLKPRSKEPATSHGFKDAVSDPQAVAGLWNSRPNSNIGLATGGWFMVLDVDMHGDVDGGTSLRAWEREHGDLPETVCAETGSGGEHLWFRVPEGVTIGCAVGVLPGVDVRGDGGYIVAPPSIHPNGSPYVWQVAPGEIEMPVMPPALVALCTQRQRKGKDKPTRCDLSAEVIREGHRDNDIFSFASKLRGMGIPYAEARAACVERGKRFEPPFTTREITAKVQQVYERYPAGHNGGSKSTRFDHVKVAHELMERRHACQIDGALAVWCDDHYALGDDSIESACIDVQPDSTQRQRREVTAYLRLKAPRFSGSDPSLVAFSNGVLNIDTMELLLPSPALHIVNRIPHRWNPQACAPVVADTLLRVANGDVHVFTNLLEVAGLCMVPDVSLGRLVLLQGRGANGKSTFLTMLEKLVGPENCAAQPVQELGERFQSESLVGKLANLGDDVCGETVSAKSCSVLKQVVLGSTIKVEPKGKPAFTYRPHCTLIFSCNSTPRFLDASDGFQRRLHPIPLTASFSRSDADYNPNIGRELAGEDAMETLAVLAVEAFRRMRERGGMQENSLVRNFREEIRLNDDPLLQFVDETAEGDGSMLVGRTVAEVYVNYRIWCESSGCLPTSKRRMASTIRDRYGLVTVTQRIDGKSAKVFQDGATHSAEQ